MRQCVRDGRLQRLAGRVYTLLFRLRQRSKLGWSHWFGYPAARFRRRPKRQSKAFGKLRFRALERDRRHPGGCQLKGESAIMRLALQPFQQLFALIVQILEGGLALLTIGVAGERAMQFPSASSHE